MIEFKIKIVTGAAIPFSVLSFSSETRVAILECPEIELVKLRTALTLQDSYQGRVTAGVEYCHLTSRLPGSACCFSVERVSPDLLSLSV